MRSELWNKDIDGAYEEIEDFKEDVDKLLNPNDKGTVLTNNIKIEQIDSIEKMEDFIEIEVENTIVVLENKCEELIKEIDTYDKYCANFSKVESFYEEIYITSETLSINMCEYSLKYAELIMASNKPNDDKYDEFEELYDCIYEDMADEIHDRIYEGIFDDINYAIYDGVLDEAEDNVSYNEWYDVRSKEYDMWYDTRSDVYDKWYNLRSDVYDFCYDIKSELWSNDTERANKKLNDFKSDVAKLSNNVISVDSTKENNMVKENNESTDNKLVDEMDSDFKAAMDSYEEFMNEYVEFIKKYSNSNGTDMSLILDYSKYMTKYADMCKDFEKWENEELNAAETAYYIDVQARVSKKLLEVAY